MKTIEQAVQIAHSLFQRGKTHGSSANMSFIDNGFLYITASSTCFGLLVSEDFVKVPLSDLNNKPERASKEFELHASIYRAKPEIKAVIHTHSTYSVLWSCLEHENTADVIPDHTPYLKMKLGAVQLVSPYCQPGSSELFSAFRQHIGQANGYLLKNHGPVVAGKTILDAFYSLEELEESAKIAWMLKNK